MEPARAQRGRPRDRLSPTRGLVYLCSRLFDHPSLGTPGARGGVFFHAPQASAQPLSPEGRREAPRCPDTEAPRGRGHSYRARHRQRGQRAGASAAGGGAYARAPRQRTTESGAEAGQEKRLSTITSPSEPVGRDPLYPPGPCHDVADDNRGQGLSPALASGAHLSIVAELSALRVYQPQDSRHDLVFSLWPYAAHGAQVCLVPVHTASLMGKEKTGTACAQSRPACPGLG